MDDGNRKGGLERGRVLSAWALSLSAHLFIGASGAYLVAKTLASGPPRSELAQHRGFDADGLIEIDVEGSPTGELVSDDRVPPETVPDPTRGGGLGQARPDMDRQGRGGTDDASAPALNLADRDDGVLLAKAPWTHLTQSQLSRILAGEVRRARENRRASRKPMEMTFLASGDERGHRRIRLPDAAVEPAPGRRWLADARDLGSAAGAPYLGPGHTVTPTDPGSATPGGDERSEQKGLQDGVGVALTDHAPLAYARPAVDQGTPSIPAEREGRPSDTLDSEQSVQALMQSIIHASTAGGKAGQGPGGTTHTGPTGSGGEAGPGSKSAALGTGGGGPPDPSLVDAARLAYIQDLRRRIQPLWAHAFPESAALEGRGGMVTITFVILPSGAVASASIARPSGIPEFDQNVRNAVLSGSPYGPLPPSLMPQFTYTLSFNSPNPAVRPKDVIQLE